MFRRLVAAIAAMLKQMGQASVDILNWMDQVLRWPFRVVFGGGGGSLAHFAPQVSTTDVIQDFKNARANAAIHAVDPCGIDTIRKYCAAPRHIRTDMDISTVPSAARTLLLTMSDNELHALSAAGPGAIKKFLDGKRHEIDGVPVVGVHAANDHHQAGQRMDHRLWKVRAELQKGSQSHTFKL